MVSDLSCYLDGQLKINLTPRRRSDNDAVTYRGEIEEVSVDDTQVYIALKWVARTTVGRYTLDTNFDLDVSFQAVREAEDGVGNLRLITEQGEEMTFFEKGDESNILPINIIGFQHVANKIISNKREAPFTRLHPVLTIKIDYADGSSDKIERVVSPNSDMLLYSWSRTQSATKVKTEIRPAAAIATLLSRIALAGDLIPDGNVIPSLPVQQNPAVHASPTLKESNAVISINPVGLATKSSSEGTGILVFLAFWLLPLLGILLVQGDNTPATEGPISIFGIWFLGIPLLAWVYRKLNSNS